MVGDIAKDANAHLVYVERLHRFRRFDSAKELLSVEQRAVRVHVEPGQPSPTRGVKGMCPLGT